MDKLNLGQSPVREKEEIVIRTRVSLGQSMDVLMPDRSVYQLSVLELYRKLIYLDRSTLTYRPLRRTSKSAPTYTRRSQPTFSHPPLCLLK